MRKYDYERYVAVDIQEFLIDNGLEMTKENESEIMRLVINSNGVVGMPRGYYNEEEYARLIVLSNWGVVKKLLKEREIAISEFARGFRRIDMAIRRYYAKRFIMENCRKDR